MANECHCTLVVRRIDKWSLTSEEIWAFIREIDSPEWQWTQVEWLNKEYYFSYQFVVPVKQDDNWWENNINARWTKWDGWYYCIWEMNDKELVLHFATPWWPPSKWLQTVCKKFPELHIIMSYDEPLMWFQWEMWRNEKWELFDNYREWDAYLHECYWCWFNLEDVTYREDAQDFLCDECYKEFLKRNPKKKWGK